MGNLAEYIAPITLVVTLLLLLFQVVAGPLLLRVHHLSAKKTRLEIRKLEAELGSAGEANGTASPSVSGGERRTGRWVSSYATLGVPTIHRWVDLGMWIVMGFWVAMFMVHFYADELTPKIVGNLVLSGCFLTLFGVILILRRMLLPMVVTQERALRVAVFTAKAVGQIPPLGSGKASSSNPVVGTSDADNSGADPIVSGSGPRLSPASEASGKISQPR